MLLQRGCSQPEPEITLSFSSSGEIRHEIPSSSPTQMVTYQRPLKLFAPAVANLPAAAAGSLQLPVLLPRASGQDSRRSEVGRRGSGSHLLRSQRPAGSVLLSLTLLLCDGRTRSKESQDLSAKAKSRFGVSLRSLSQPMSLREMARTWDVCARKVMEEYARQHGGGSFSSRYGTWENCVAA